MKCVAIKPSLQPLNVKTLIPASANHNDDAEADIYARCFWVDNRVLLDIRVFHPNAQK